MTILNLPWTEGKTYRTRGGLCATITRIKPHPIPKELPKADLERILNKPFYGIEGYVWLESNPAQRARGSWTYLGKHTISEEDTPGDLTEEKLFEEEEENDETETD